MHIPIKSERQRRRALRLLMEVEAAHVAQCECPERCKMLRELREEIAWVRGQRNRKRFKCRDLCRSILHSRLGTTNSPICCEKDGDC
jgi:hypothetical protein